MDVEELFTIIGRQTVTIAQVMGQVEQKGKEIESLKAQIEEFNLSGPKKPEEKK